jgi:hypothetical protein
MMYSLNSTSLVLKSYEIGSNGKASFTIYNPGPDDEYELGGIAVQEDGLWHDCAPTNSPLPWQLASCEYFLDSTRNSIGFKLQWYCDDRDPYHP